MNISFSRPNMKFIRKYVYRVQVKGRPAIRVPVSADCRDSAEQILDNYLFGVLGYAPENVSKYLYSCSDAGWRN